jgi:small GTP-binding protein
MNLLTNRYYQLAKGRKFASIYNRIAIRHLLPPSLSTFSSCTCPMKMNLIQSPSASYYYTRSYQLAEESNKDSSSSPSNLSCILNDEEQRELLSSASTDYIRNFSIIAHIDHGKSTLADRLLEIAGNIRALSKQDAQVLDNLQIERERGITVKAQTASMFYRDKRSGKKYLLNLIDTPGHVDFSYEVSRSLAACQGALLLVDSSQGVQAQTLANYYTAMDANLDIIPVLSKIDLPHSDIKSVGEQLQVAFDIDPDTALHISSKTGLGIDKVFEAIIDRVKPPPNEIKPGFDVLTVPLRALVFDSW